MFDFQSAWHSTCATGRLRNILIAICEERHFIAGSTNSPSFSVYSLHLESVLSAISRCYIIIRYVMETGAFEKFILICKITLSLWLLKKRAWGRKIRIDEYTHDISYSACTELHIWTVLLWLAYSILKNRKESPYMINNGSFQSSMWI